MRMMKVGQWLLGCGTLTVVAACSDAPTAPIDPRPSPVSANIGGCGGIQQSGAAPARAAQAGSVQSASVPIAGVTITATYNPWSTGLGYWLNSRFNYPAGYGAELAPCLSSDVAGYAVDDAVPAIYLDIPAPPGVDPGVWASLSIRERHILMAKAREMVEVNSGRYPNIGAAINALMEEKILPNKVDARYRARDFLSNPDEQDMLAGAVYGCMLYNAFARDPLWHLSNDATLTFVVDLATAFAESQYITQPLRGLQFGRNGAVGAAMAQNSYGSDCGWLAFQSISSGRVKVTDPMPAPGGGGPRGGPGGGPPDDMPEWY